MKTVPEVPFSSLPLNTWFRIPCENGFLAGLYVKTGKAVYGLKPRAGAWRACNLEFPCVPVAPPLRP